MAFRKLFAFQKSFKLAMMIFSVSKSFPVEERYSLTDQIRRSSRGVSVNIAEAYRKRRYQRHFISKLSDSDSENAETQTWLLFAKETGYINEKIFFELMEESVEVGKLINYMIQNPEKFGSSIP